LEFGLVSVLPTAAESAASAAKTSASVAVAGLAVKPAVGSVVSLGRLERQFRDVRSALGALESKSRDVMHLALGSVLIVHSWFA